MTIWNPSLERFEGPKYLALADALANDVARGALGPGEKLPTHRELAERLGVTVGTVSRGYAEALRRGLVHGEVGRGTFVASLRPAERELGHWLCVPQFADPEMLSLHLNTPTGGAAEAEVREALLRVASCPELSPLLHYQHSAGVGAHRRAGVRWLEHMGLASTEEQVVVAAGGQHAICLVLAALVDPGDNVLCEQLCYQGVTNASHLLNLRLHGVPMDDFGMIPAEFDAACRRHHPRAVYLTPTFQNPTASVMPVDRRMEIAEVASSHNVYVIEDDIYAFYAGEPLPSITSMVGDLGVFLSSMSKSIAPGLRIAFIHAPPGTVHDIVDSVWSTTIMAPPLMGAVAATLIENGSVETIFDRRRDQARRYQELVDERLGAFVAPSNDRRSAHVWLDLPEPWRTSDFVAAAEARKVAVAPADMFAVGRVLVPHSVRISLVAVRNETELIRGLDVLAELFHSPPQPRRTSM